MKIAISEAAYFMGRSRQTLYTAGIVENGMVEVNDVQLALRVDQRAAEATLARVARAEKRLDEMMAEAQS